MQLGVDYSFARPDPAQIKAAGYDMVLRYLASSAPAQPKVLTIAERNALWAAGLGIGLVWEESAQRALAGRDAGVADATAANAMAAALGVPADVIIFFAVDFDAAPDQVRPYFEGVHSVRPRCGCYGGNKVIDPLMAAGLIQAGWQAGAASWSNGKVSPNASIVQRTSATVAHPIPSTDENAIATTDGWGWFAAAATVPPAAPAPTSDVASIIDYMGLLHSMAAALSTAAQANGQPEQAAKLLHAAEAIASLQ